MHDVKETIRKIVVSERWRLWLGAAMFLGGGAFLVVIGASEGPFMTNILAALLTGIACLALGGFFLWRAIRLPAAAARLAETFASRPREIAWVYEQEVRGRYGVTAWNFFVWTADGRKTRLMASSRSNRDLMWSALRASAPHAVMPYSRERERDLKARRRESARVMSTA
jgi:hypothetical protein